MRYLKSYNKLFETHQSIHDLCKKHGITDYTINEDGSIDVHDDVHLFDIGLTKLPLNFRNVTGNFYCNNNQLTSLEGGPRFVGGNFYCYDNQLTSLEGAPESVGRDFYCRDNQLTSLEGAPESVGRDFNCSNNKLTSLEGTPSHVGGGFYCYDNQLTSLEGSPQSVNGNFYCYNNQLTSLEGAPQSVGRDFECSNNPCNPIYQDWINGDRRSDLLEMMEDYDFLRSETIIWDRLESFFNDNDLKLPNKEELRKNYKII